MAPVHSRRDPEHMGKLRPYVENQVVFPRFGWLVLAELRVVFKYYILSFHKLFNT